MGLPQPDPDTDLADLEIGTWTAEQGTPFETAQWVLGALIARVSVETAAENTRPVPDPARIEDLAADRAHLASLRRRLTAHDPDIVQKVLSIYGAQARAQAEARRTSATPGQFPQVGRDE